MDFLARIFKKHEEVKKGCRKKVLKGESRNILATRIGGWGGGV